MHGRPVAVRHLGDRLVAHVEASPAGAPASGGRQQRDQSRMGPLRRGSARAPRAVERPMASMKVRHAPWTKAAPARAKRASR